jgi:hypothetical protein
MKEADEIDKVCRGYRKTRNTYTITAGEPHITKT